MMKKIAFTMYPAKDIKRARDFYENILNIKVGDIFEKQPQGIWVEYDLPEGGCLAITDMVEVTPSTEAGGSIAFEVDDIDAVIADLKAKGVKFKMEKITTEVCSFAVILDSEGNAVTLHQLKNK